MTGNTIAERMLFEKYRELNRTKVCAPLLSRAVRGWWLYCILRPNSCRCIASRHALTSPCRHLLQNQAAKMLRAMQSERGLKRAAEDEDEEQRMLKAKLVLEESVCALGGVGSGRAHGVVSLGRAPSLLERA